MRAKLKRRLALIHILPLVLAGIVLFAPKQRSGVAEPWALLAAMAVGIGLLLTLGNAYLRIFLSADKITMDTVRYGNTFLYVDYAMYLFLGFIFPSIFIIAKEEYACIQKKWQYTPFVILGIAIVAALTYMNSKVQVVDVDLTHFSVPTALYLFLAGAVAITAMFLPGISGSTVLLIFGVYLPVISGVKELLHLHFGVLPMIIVFGVGVICGALVSVKGIQKSLEKYRGQMVMLILGMLIGSLYAIVSGPVTVDKANAILNKDNFSIVFFLIGLALMVLLQVVKTKLEKKQKTQN